MKYEGLWWCFCSILFEEDLILLQLQQARTAEDHRQHLRQRLLGPAPPYLVHDLLNYDFTCKSLPQPPSDAMPGCGDLASERALLLVAAARAGGASMLEAAANRHPQLFRQT